MDDHRQSLRKNVEIELEVGGHHHPSLHHKSHSPQTMVVVEEEEGLSNVDDEIFSASVENVGGMEMVERRSVGSSHLSYAEFVSGSAKIARFQNPCPILPAGNSHFFSDRSRIIKIIFLFIEYKETQMPRAARNSVKREGVEEEEEILVLEEIEDPEEEFIEIEDDDPHPPMASSALLYHPNNHSQNDDDEICYYYTEVHRYEVPSSQHEAQIDATCGGGGGTIEQRQSADGEAASIMPEAIDVLHGHPDDEGGEGGGAEQGQGHEQTIHTIYAAKRHPPSKGRRNVTREGKDVSVLEF